MLGSLLEWKIFKLWKWSMDYSKPSVCLKTPSECPMRSVYPRKVRKCRNWPMGLIQMTPEHRDESMDVDASSILDSWHTFRENCRSSSPTDLQLSDGSDLNLKSWKLEWNVKKTLTKSDFRDQHDREVSEQNHRFFRVSMSIKWVEKVFSTKMFKCPTFARMERCVSTTTRFVKLSQIWKILRFL